MTSCCAWYPNNGDTSHRSLLARPVWVLIHGKTRSRTVALQQALERERETSQVISAPSKPITTLRQLRPPTLHADGFREVSGAAAVWTDMTKAYGFIDITYKVCERERETLSPAATLSTEHDMFFTRYSCYVLALHCTCSLDLEERSQAKFYCCSNLPVAMYM